MRFDWAEDAKSIPIVSKPPPRDLSALRSPTPHLFVTLQRRTRQHPVAHWNYPSRTRTVDWSAMYSRPNIVTHRHPSGIAPGKPIVTIPSGTQPQTKVTQTMSAPHLDWDGDPRLSDLSCALRALGWVHR
jgi:hypothetical protein